MTSALSEEKQRQLEAFLSGLPSKHAVTLADAIERDRLAGGRGLPHDLILNALRPVLRNAAVSGKRLQTPKRLFCAPFEDLFIDGPRSRKQRGRIARASMDPVWEWLTNTLMPEKHAQLYGALSKAILSGDDAARQDLAREMWSVAGALILREIPAPPSGEPALKGLSERLGGDMVLADAFDMARVLEAGEQIMAMKADLEPLCETLTDEDLTGMRSHYREISDRLTDSAPYVPLIVMSRLKHPWDIFRVLFALSNQETDTLIAQTDMSLAGDLLLEDLEEIGEALHRLDYTDFDPDTVVDALKQFSHMSSGMTHSLGLRKDGPWWQRLTAARRMVSEHMTGLMERAESEILAAVPVRRFGSYGSKGPRIPDISKWPDRARTERAVMLAGILDRIRGYASAAAFEGAYKDTMMAVEEGLDLYSGHILDEIRKSDGESKPIAIAYKDIAVKLTGFIQGAESAELLERRGVAAAG